MANLIDTDESGGVFTLTDSSLNVNVPVTVNATLAVDGALTAGSTSITGNTTVTGNLTTTGNLTVGGAATWASSIVGITKLFDIEHPTKQDMRLRHGCLEGPELAVYTRGKTSEGIIPLPDYWQGLVDDKTITVHLTPTNMDQTLVVNNVNGLSIQVLGNHRLPYYYYVMAERKDVEKLDVEQHA